MVSSLTKHKDIYLVRSEPKMAKALDLNTMGWEIGLSIGIGLSLGCAIHLAGWLFVFGTMILPVYITRRFASSIKQISLFIPLLSLVLNAVAFVLAHELNYAYSQFSIAFLGTCYLFSLIMRPKR